MISKRLSAAIEEVASSAADRRFTVTEQFHRSGGHPPDTLPVTVRAPRVEPKDSEGWDNYEKRVLGALGPLQDKLSDVVGVQGEALVASNGLAFSADPDQIGFIDEFADTEFIELDDVVELTDMDDAADDIELPAFRVNHGPLTGRGVRVAVLDSGIDLKHPFLNVAETVSTCSESDAIPGSHGTHCAGSVASRDARFGGIAPDVTLINVKVVDSLGRGNHSDIDKGVSAALARDADIVSMSLGFNHLPRGSAGGHGWVCPGGSCILCRAVDTAVALGAFVVVAAGNEHDRAEALRRWRMGGSFDTELGCPGQARDSLTVAALVKRTFATASFSSHGPTAYGTSKPDIAAPGVNIWSTTPVPRNASGVPLPSPPRSSLFGRKSGTSMATPIVAGAAALIVENLRNRGASTKPSDIRIELLGRAVTTIPGVSPGEVGAGRLDLSRL